VTCHVLFTKVWKLLQANGFPGHPRGMKKPVAFPVINTVYEFISRCLLILLLHVIDIDRRSQSTPGSDDLGQMAPLPAETIVLNH
jgi:hypothetical protein